MHANVIFGRTSEVLAIVFLDLLDSSSTSGSGSGTRTRDTAIMSRLLYRLSYPAVVPAAGVPADQRTRMGAVFRRCAACNGVADRAPMWNRTADLLLTMETLCLLSYRGRLDAR